MIFWKDIIARLKRRLSYEDLRRISNEFAKSGREIEPLSTALSKLAKMDFSKDWFWQWELNVSPSLRKISDAKSRETQALQCRVEIIQNQEAIEYNDFLITFKDSEVRDILLSHKYSDVPNLTEQERWGTLIMHYAFSLLTGMGLSGLYEQQFEKYLPYEEFTKPHIVVCRAYTKILCYTLIFTGFLIWNEDPEVKSIASTYKHKISDKILHRLHEAKEDYEAWIQAGHVEGIDTYRARFLSIINEYSDSLESAKKSLETLSEKLGQRRT